MGRKLGAPGLCGPTNDGWRGLGHAKVEQLETRPREQHIIGLHVAMDDARLVRGCEGVGDLDTVLDCLVERELATRQPPGERLTVQVLHDQELDPVLVADVVQAADVRVIERGNRFCLAREARSELGVGRQFR